MLKINKDLLPQKYKGVTDNNKNLYFLTMGMETQTQAMVELYMEIIYRVLMY